MVSDGEPDGEPLPGISTMMDPEQTRLLEKSQDASEPTRSTRPTLKTVGVVALCVAATLGVAAVAGGFSTSVATQTLTALVVGPPPAPTRDGETASPTRAPSAYSFPLGVCDRRGAEPRDLWPVHHNRSCYQACWYFGLIPKDTDPDCRQNPWGFGRCVGSHFKTFQECQVMFPDQGTRRRDQCLCGPEGDQTILCDSFYHDFNWRLPPLECTGMNHEPYNLTSKQDCEDYLSGTGQDTCYRKPCKVQWQQFGGKDMCSFRYSHQYEPDRVQVHCGDVCAYMDRDTDVGAARGPGLVVILAVAIFAAII